MIKLIMISLMGLMTNNGPNVKPTTYTIDTEKSVIEWVAQKVTGKHNGRVPISGGSLVIDGKTLVKGDFTANLAALTVDDIKGDKLPDHLRSEDFFNTAKFATASFTMTKATITSAGTYDITGNLVIKGISKPISFNAAVAPSGNQLLGTATLKVDRTKYDIKYRSSNFVENLGDKAIYDEFELTVKLVMNKS